MADTSVVIDQKVKHLGIVVKEVDLVSPERTVLVVHHRQSTVPLGKFVLQTLGRRLMGSAHLDIIVRVERT